MTPEERREYPRADWTDVVEVVLADGTRLPADTVNLSRAGIQLEADEHTRDRIFPAGQPATPSARPQLTVGMRLRDAAQAEPGAGDGGWVHATGEAVLYRRVGADCYRVGIRFLELEEDTFRALEQFVYQHGR